MEGQAQPNSLGIRASSVGRVSGKHIPYVWHTNAVWVCISPALKYFQNANDINLSECMLFGCHQPDAVVSQANPVMSRCVLAFRQLSSLLYLGKGWCGDFTRIWKNPKSNELRL